MGVFCALSGNPSRAAGPFLVGNKPAIGILPIHLVFVPVDAVREQYISLNHQELGDSGAGLAWVTPEAAITARRERSALLAALEKGGAQSTAGGSKLFTRTLSPGCRTCGQGTWSCLFINNICNARCFYCPTPQKSKDEPTTNGLRFSKPRDYINYLEKFGFTGSSVSGGEPLMTLERTLTFLRRLKEHFGPRLHVWLYTNALLLTPALVKQLEKIGLDEIRFDISANHYRLDKVALAAGRIPTITVEIPALPEDFSLLAQTMEEMDRAGVNHLNLHQLRLTPHNQAHLLPRGYTFVHGPKATVLESELTALRLLEFALHKDLQLGVNYCSYIYKHRFQNLGNRRRSGAVICKPLEELTPAGLIRSLSLRGESTVLRELAAGFNNGTGGWQLNTRADTLHLSAPLLPRNLPEGISLLASYHSAALKQAHSYCLPFQEIMLNAKRRLIVEKSPMALDLAVPRECYRPFREMIQAKDGVPPLSTPPARDGADWEKLMACEQLDTGLADYF